MENYYATPSVPAASPYLDLATLGIGRPSTVATRRTAHLVKSPHFVLFDEETVALLNPSPVADAIVKQLPLTFAFDGHTFAAPQRFGTVTNVPVNKLNTSVKRKSPDVDERPIDHAETRRILMAKFNQTRGLPALLTKTTKSSAVDAAPIRFYDVRRSLAASRKFYTIAMVMPKSKDVDESPVDRSTARQVLQAAHNNWVKKSAPKSGVDARRINFAATRRALANSRKFYTLAQAHPKSKHVDESPLDWFAAKRSLQAAHKHWVKHATKPARHQVDACRINFAATRRALASSRKFWTLAAAGKRARLVDAQPIDFQHARQSLLSWSKMRAVARGSVAGVEHWPVDFCSAKRAVTLAMAPRNTKPAPLRPSKVPVEQTSGYWWPLAVPATPKCPAAPASTPSPTPIMATSGYWWPFARPESATGIATQTPPELPPRRAAVATSATQFEVAGTADMAVGTATTGIVSVPRILIDAMAGTDEMAHDLHQARIAEMADEFVSSILNKALSELALTAEAAEVPVVEESAELAAAAEESDEESEYEFVDARTI